MLPEQMEASSDSSSDDDHQLPDAETRKTNPCKGVRALKKENKVKRNLGQSYTTLKGRIIPERRTVELTSCRMKCKDRIPLCDRQAIFTEYWQMGSHSRRSAYMASLMEIQDKASERIRSSDPDKQKFRFKTYKYCLSVNGKSEPVCRGCLLKILNESDNFIKTVAEKKSISTGGTETDDLRGKTTPRHKVPDLKREEIKAHILSFPSYVSHYTRKSTSKQYLPSHLTLQKMYQLYRESHENPPSIKIYSEEFHKLKLSFKKPRADTCFTCDKFRMQIELSQDGNTKSNLIAEHEQHKMLGDQGYEQKGLDTLLYKDDDNVQVYTFDLQQCLPTPSLTSSVVFYKRQLWTYNLTVHNNKTGKAVCYVWYETVAARGANQIASCLYKHVNTYVPRNTKRVIFYSDTCSGQNRNSHVSAMFTWALQNLDIETIDHKFMVPGHSHLEVDTDHSIIEKKKKKTELQIFHPHDWMQLIRSSSKKFEVVEMLSNDFFDFASLLKGPLVLRGKDTNGRQFKWLKKRWLQYVKGEFGMIMYKDTLDRDAPFSSLNLKRRGSVAPDSVPVISSKPIPISKEKKEDLVSLFPLIPNVFHDFYANLPSAENLRNTDPDIMEDEQDPEF